MCCQHVCVCVCVCVRVSVSEWWKAERERGHDSPATRKEMEDNDELEIFFKISVRIISTERILIRTLSILALFLSLSHAATLALTHTHTYTPYPTESHIVTAVTHSYSLNRGMLYMPLSLNNRVKHLPMTQHTQSLTVSPTLTPFTTHTIIHSRTTVLGLCFTGTCTLKLYCLSNRNFLGWVLWARKCNLAYIIHSFYQPIQVSWALA